MIILGWNCCSCDGFSNILGFSKLGSSILACCGKLFWASICWFMGSGSFLISFIFWPILSLKFAKNEGCGFVFCDSGFEFVAWIGSFFSSSLKKDSFGFWLIGSAFSSSSKNDNFGFGLGTSAIILFSLATVVLFPKLSNKFNLGFGFSCSRLRFALIFVLTFILILLFKVIFFLSWSLSFSSKNENFGLFSFCLGPSSNILNLFSFFSLFWFCWANKFTFSVISLVLSTIVIESISSSSSLSNRFFNLFLAFSNFLFFLISIAFVSFWFWNKICDCITWGWGWGICWFIWIWVICWFIWICGICWFISSGFICSWGGLIIEICSIGICWFWFCCGICSGGCGLGIPIIIIGFSWFWLIWGWFICGWFSIIFWFICGICICGWIMLWGFLGCWVGLLLKILPLISS